MKVFFGTLKATDALWRFFSGNLLLLLALAGMVTACYFCRKGGPIKPICFFSPIEGERARFRLFTDDDRSQASKPSFIQFL